MVLAASHALVRHSLRLLLDGEKDIEVIVEANDLASVVGHVQDVQPHVLVLDLSMPDGSSLEAISQLRERVPRTQVVALTMEEDPELARRSFAAGAVGFVMTEVSDAELPRAIRAAVDGEEYISPRAAAQLDAIQQSLTDGRLTSREVNVLRLIAHGLTSVEIGRKLRISPRTVEAHRAHISAKLRLATRAELVHYALGRGLLGA